MAMTMKIEIVARETIKPSSPTPQHLRKFKLSLLDQTAPSIYTSLLLFYSVNDDDHHRHPMQAAQRSQHLKTSLSKMLTEFYPLAGIIKDHTAIECNDDGAQYIETRVNRFLSEVLQQHDSLILRNLLPAESEFTEVDTGRVLLVQANFFECGGMVVGLCISHKIADVATLTTVLKSWSEIAVSGSSDLVKLPEFNAASVFPPLDSKIPPVKMIHHNFITKRFVFESSKIVTLKAKAASATVEQPTRVETVTALIWKCMTNISRSTKGFPRPSMMCQAVDLRKRSVPPFPENCIGNILGGFFAAHSTENEIDLKELVCKLRKELIEYNKTALQTNNIQNENLERMSRVKNLTQRDDTNTEFYVFTNWCRFPIYETDFGWGKPTWATLPKILLKNMVFFMDTRDGEGIEALVALSKEEMALFEGEQELLEFAVVNPKVC